MKNKVMLVLILAFVASLGAAVPLQARHHRNNDLAIGVGLGAFCLGALLGSNSRQRETVVYEQPVVYQPVVYEQPAYMPAPVQYVSPYYQQVHVQRTYTTAPRCYERVEYYRY